MTKKKVIIIVIGVVLVFGLIAAGVIGYSTYQSNKREVEVQPVSYINWGYWGDSETSYGMLTNDSAQEIYLDGSLNVQEVYVEKGETVKIGQPLMAYDVSEIQMSIERKELEINTLENEIVQATYRLNELKNSSPVDKTPPQMDEDKYEDLMDKDNKNNSIKEKDKKDSRVYNYLTDKAVPFNGLGTGTQADPYIYCVNKKAYAYGSFYNDIRPTATDADGVSVRIIVPQKDGKGKVITDANGMPVVDTSVTQNTKIYNGDQIPAEYDSDKMWYIFSGEERRPSDLAGEYRDEFLDGLENWMEPDGYTKEELFEEIAYTEKSLKDLDISRRRLLLELESMKKSTPEGIVYAQVDGTVTVVGDPEDSSYGDAAFLVVSGSEGLYVSGTISELLLGDVTIGTVVTANSWESGMTFEATITEISDYPVSGNAWGEGNPNVSYYEYTAFIEDSSSLQNGEYVDLSIATNKSDVEGGIFIDKAYVREEDGKSYCMIADEEGRLKKQYIVTGRTVYESAIEVKSGLSEEDLIAFPYGKDVVEGAKTVEASETYY